VTGLRDDKGCLTAAGLQALREAPPGKAEAELASHLAGCARCQERLLAGDVPRGARPKKTPPPPWRLGLVVVLVVLVVLTVMATLQRLGGGAP
jgi:hypothetical protein